MICPRCGCPHVNIQVVTNTQTKGKGCLYWLFVGWWLEPLLWVFLTIPMILIKLFSSGGKTVTTSRKVAICQNCGYSWYI